MPQPGQAVKAQSAEIGERGKSGRFGLSFNERLDELSDLVLLVARKLAGPLKNLPQLSRRAFATRLCGVTAKEIFNTNIQHPGQLFNLLRAQRHRVTLPNAIAALGHAHLFGYLRLAQARRFACSVQTSTEGRAWFFGWSACLHGASITQRIFR